MPSFPPYMCFIGLCKAECSTHDLFSRVGACGGDQEPCPCWPVVQNGFPHSVLDALTNSWLSAGHWDCTLSLKNQALRAGLGEFEQLVLALVGFGVWSCEGDPSPTALARGKPGVQSPSSLSPWENTFPFPRTLPVPGCRVFSGVGGAPCSAWCITEPPPPQGVFLGSRGAKRVPWEHKAAGLDSCW